MFWLIIPILRKYIQITTEGGEKSNEGLRERKIPTAPSVARDG